MYALLCGLLFLLASCENNRRTAIDPQEPPTALQRISERAEGIMIAVPAEDWPRVYAFVQDIDNTWRDYKNPAMTGIAAPPQYPTGLLLGDLDAAVAGLKYGAAARDAEGTIKAAGEVSGAVAVLIGYYNPDRPSALHRIAMQEKQIMIQATEGDLAAASANLENIRIAWDRARPTVRDRTSDVVVQGFDQLIAEQRAAIQARNLPRLASGAKDALRMINDMQQLEY